MTFKLGNLSLRKVCIGLNSLEPSLIFHRPPKLSHAKLVALGVHTLLRATVLGTMALALAASARFIPILDQGTADSFPLAGSKLFPFVGGVLRN